MRIPRTTAVLLPLFLLFASCKSGEGTVKVGLLHSLSGTMAISEAAVRDAELLAIAEINAAGGTIYSGVSDFFLRRLRCRIPLNKKTRRALPQKRPLSSL